MEMYECEHCGCRKTTLSGAPTYELRRTSTGTEVVGERRWIYDTCSICRNVRFFRQLEEDDEASLEEPPKSQERQISKAKTEPEPGDGFGDGQDQVVPVMQRVKMLEGKAKEANPKPTKGQLGGKQPEPETDAESLVVSSSETVTESFAFDRATSGGDSGKPCTPRISFQIPLKRYSLQPGLKCKRKTMRRLASIRLDVNHQLRKTELELRELEERRVQALNDGDCSKGIGALLDSVVELLLEQSLFKDKASQTEHGAGDGRLLSAVEQLRHLVETVSTVKRCSYQSIGYAARQAFCGMKHTDCTTKALQAEDQFRTVSFTDKELLGALASKAHLFEDTAPKQPLYTKEPMLCPDLHCPKTCYPSGLNDHLLSDHPGLKAKPVGLRQSETLYMDPKALPLNEATCLQLYEVKDKITHAQAGWKGDVLPVLVMAARARFSNDSDFDDEEDALLVWLSSFRPADIRLYGTLSVWSPRAYMADTLTVLTGQPHDICTPKDLATMLRSPCTVVVPHAQLQRMTARNGGPEPSLIAVQVQFQ
ncbi:uncharacterized protein LOC108165177 [Drosophila miranda]|uniref:uncharacterized protein LOC108165177 n=1 Tax=Drosophila miranda TaxID=7229 RepID=UPI0007E7E373|nr:uncharacterized protein LOC108165177 [Drosophila miranda]